MSLRPKKINFDTTFTEFRSGLDQIYALQSQDKLSGIRLHELVYDMCVAVPKPFVEPLFNAVALYLTDLAGKICERILQQQDLVSAYATEWETYRLASSYTNIICEYLNRMLLRIKDTSTSSSSRSGSSHNTSSWNRFKSMTIEALAYLLWKDRVIYEIKIHHSNRLVYQLMEYLRRDRDGAAKEFNTDSVAVVIQSFVELNQYTDAPYQLYIEEFEKSYLENTRVYYETESATLIGSATISVFMDRALQRLHDESGFCSRYLDSNTHEKSIKEVEKCYITMHHQRLVNEFQTMVSESRYGDCRNAYRLVSRIQNGVNPLLHILERHVNKLGKALVAKLGTTVLKEPKEYVEPLMVLQIEYMEIVNEYFGNDAEFVAAVDKAFRAVVNDTVTNVSVNAPEVLARYCDGLLKRNLKQVVSEQELDDKFTRLITLFKYVDDKDIFQKFYSRMLAKRLIQGTSYSDDAEANMISRLKGACGFEYTSRLQRMFTDMAISQDLTTRFSEFVSHANIDLGVEFGVQVLTQGAWPLSGQTGVEFTLPVELEKSVASFMTFYMNHHNGRKLTWMYHLSKADVRCFGFDKRYELAVSVYQLAVLGVLNRVDESGVKVSEVARDTGIGGVELRKVMKPLLDIRLIEVVEGKWEDETGGDERVVVRVNEKFTSKRTKIKVSSHAQTEQTTTQETDATRKAVEEDRRLFIQATIVRVMKSRKELFHTQLVQEVIDQSKARFAPSVPMIKKSIEHLIEKQYIDRDETVREKYLYVA